MMDRRAWTPRDLLSIAALGAIAVMGSFAWASSQAHEQVHRSDNFWAYVTYRGAQIDSCPSAREMLEDADAVVVGRFVAMEPGRVMGEPENDNAAYYLDGTFEIAELIFQNTNNTEKLDPGNTIRLETFTFEASKVKELAGSYPTERTLVFLRNKGVSAERIGLARSVVAAESDYYRAMCAEGVVRDLPSGPAAVIPDDDRLRDFALATFDDAVGTARALAAEQRARDE